MRIDYLKPGRCPYCFAPLPHPAMVNITLSNNTVMPQPVCDDHFTNLLRRDDQIELLKLIKLVWIEEIKTSEQRTEEDKQKVITDIEKIEVLGGED